MKKRVGIIGGGASGLVAAIGAARNGAEVTVIEHMDRVGKKILSTGNGRCNLTNYKMEEDCYRCGRKDFPMQVIRKVNVNETLEFFMELGIVPKNRNGYIYPNSDQAASVLDVLREEIERLKIRILLSCHVEKIEKKNGGFFIHTDQGTVETDALILAAGSKAAPSTGSDGSGYEYARQLGHSIIKPLPALVQLRCQGNMYKQMAGIRTEAEVSLQADGITLAKDKGELQITDYGLSGIPVFQVSRYAARALDEKKKVRVYVDFMPGWDNSESFRLLKKRALLLAYKPAAELFTGMLNRKLAQVLLKLAGIDGNISCGSLTGKQLEKICKELKEYEAVVMSVNPFANAQVCCGGVDTNEIDETTMESRFCPGLYMAGEILDVDGICGGYNLQFAWSSGLIAGRCAAGGAGKQEMKTEPEKWEKKQLGQRNPEKRNPGKKSVEKKNIEKKSVEKKNIEKKNIEKNRNVNTKQMEKKTVKKYPEKKYTQKTRRTART